ncbi:hypothetical protein F0562_016445 [Nyssa sinensis]|uniref:Uncharacterized protein n=1 Tax=Nyssa sinensis TaxID=561372 RepID=A0A5J4ZNX9_9ASTE|nr:hypothetical protein F0562_016445 [Nyssa sinensis]
MELKPSITAIFLLFLLFAAPCFSRGLYPWRLEVAKKDSGIYDIDYRGPETHSYKPPPNLSGAKPSAHGERVMAPHKSKGLRAANARKIVRHYPLFINLSSYLN